MKKHSFSGVQKTVLFFLIIAIIYYAIIVLTQPKTSMVTVVNGKADLTQTDLGNMIAVIPNMADWIFYPNSLHTPFDIDEGVPGTFHNDIQYGTYRILLRLPPNQIYGLSMRSANFSQRTFINGQEQNSVGTVGASREDTAPKTIYCTFYFAPQTEQTEILIQYANFHHKTSGAYSGVYISEYQNINRQNQTIIFNTCIIVGCMVTIFIFNLGMFLFFEKRKKYLFFLVCCLSIGLRALIIDDKVIMVLIPDLNWYISLAIEYLSSITAIVTFAAFIHSMFPALIHRFFRYGIYAVSVVYAVIVLFAPTIFYSKLLIYYELCIAALFIYIFVRLAFYMGKWHLENNITLVGLSVFGLGALHDIFYYAFDWHIFGIRLPMEFTQISMMVCVFSNMIAMAVQFSRIEDELNETLQKERILSEENLLLDHLNKMRAEFLGNVTHEMKTPLAVMSGYAQLSDRKIQKGMAADVAPYLAKIAAESDRLALLAGQLLNLAHIQEKKEELRCISLYDVAKEAVDNYNVLVEASGNRLKLLIPIDFPGVLADWGLILQVMLNLLANSNKYTANGVITISAAERNGMAYVSLSDTGQGMTQKQADTVFTRFSKGESKDSTGLGLAICKEIVNIHGGEIFVESELTKGTTVTFTLKICKRGTQKNE